MHPKAHSNALPIAYIGFLEPCGKVNLPSASLESIAAIFHAFDKPLMT